MDEVVLTRLQDAGIDTDDLLERCMGNANLAGRLLGKFLSDSTYEKLCAALQSNDREEAITASHTLKGVCANLSMKKLQALCEEQLALLRADKFAEAKALQGEIDTACTAMRAALKEVLSQG